MSEHDKKIDAAFEKLNQLRNQSIIVTTPQELESLEKQIISASDSLTSALLAQKVQESLNSDELNQDSKTIIQNYPKSLKNQGNREVILQPSRGEPFIVKVPYFSQKEKKHGKKNE